MDNTTNNIKKLLVLIVGPSGSGKSTLEKKLLEDYSDHYEKVTSHTTRPIRKNEKNNIDYYFLTEEEFEAKEKNGDFIECISFNGNKYGVSKEEILKKQKNILLVVSPEGMTQILKHYHASKDLKEKYKIAIVYMDIQQKEREKNMKKRGDSPEEIQQRINDGIEEEFKKKNILPDVIVRKLYPTIHKDVHSQLSLFRKIYS